MITWEPKPWAAGGWLCRSNVNTFHCAEFNGGGETLAAMENPKEVAVISTWLAHQVDAGS